ncbi:MAG: response regulator [Gammaproteobacteria bacterium]
MGASGQVVLLIEDNASNMRFFHDLLQVHGCKVMQAMDGTSGWHMARELRPDVILLDVQLPDVSGLDVITWLKADDDLSSIPVIALTAFAMNGDREMFLQKGFDAYISKPVSIPDFLRVVDGLLDTNVTYSVA